MNKADIIKLAANGNAHAEAFLAAYVERAHHIDDLFDGDRPTAIATSETDWLLCLAANPFFEQHKEHLVPLMICGINAWADSNNMPPGTVRDVVKGQWHEVVWWVAFATGGWAHMRKVSGIAREYDIEVNSPPEVVPIKQA